MSIGDTNCNWCTWNSPNGLENGGGAGNGGRWFGLVCLVLWHINFCRLFNAKSIFMQIICSIENSSV